ncbi:TlpA disulfide reductase family protein [Gordonia sp. (in: high G+C Gram-positive bacteria)]|uniref:TlpA disulfide reductase family protein n=1 Tax=Gordonia sp. (in: high G+C Gram-positive bacteria) TaxID=84139 RepID=UPI0016AFA3B0|nr:TlpA disulfide reductase family protein [Gordonia sp. (in: high G+C Gram-positive bacteria)]NLG46504.1 TlpA family protein disulfide reductase [Gordonia sp. (in: high G+C Gram-positive bacteria)]
MKLLKEPATRATIVFVVIVVAAIVALWPRDSEPSSTGPTAGPIAGQTALPEVSDQELAKLRADVALRPCPDAPGPAAPGAALAGVTVPCMASGEPVNLGNATAGKPLVINMWAVWCLPCRKELPLFDEFSQRAGDRLNVLAVHAREGGDNELFVLKFLEEVGVHVPVVTDPKGDVAKAVEAPRIFPSTILVSADGKVVKVLSELFETEAEIADVVREHLGVDIQGAAS